jgi:hypothetical protein
MIKDAIANNPKLPAPETIQAVLLTSERISSRGDRPQGSEVLTPEKNDPRSLKQTSFIIHYW